MTYQPATGPSRRNGVIIGWALAAILVFVWWRTTEQWINRGCDGSRAAGYALSEGEPEWYQYCEPRTRREPEPTPMSTPSVVPEPMRTMKYL